ncbi:MAG TPA: hypothetical protein VIC62_04605, partial [Nakamurella sp.]
MTRRRARAALLGGLAALAVLAGCTSVVAGNPQPDGTPSPSRIVTDPATAGGASSSPTLRPDPAATTGAPTATPTPPPTGTDPTGGGPTGGDPSTSSIDPDTGPTTTGSADGPEAGGSAVTGADGAGDPYYPKSGNGGYEVDSYDISLTYDPASNDLTATTTIKAT